jgi:hypothetical protein
MIYVWDIRAIALRQSLIQINGAGNLFHWEDEKRRCDVGRMSRWEIMYKEEERRCGDATGTYINATHLRCGKTAEFGWLVGKAST